MDEFVPNFPPDTLADSLSPEGGIVDLEALNHSLRELSHRLGSTLREKDRSAKQVQMRLELEDDSVVKRQRTFVKSIDREHPLRVALNQLVQPIPEQPIRRIQIRLGPTEKVRRIQRDLEGRTDRGERDRSADLAVLRLRDTLGAECIMTGAERGEPRRAKVLRMWRDVLGC